MTTIHGYWKYSSTDYCSVIQDLLLQDGKLKNLNAKMHRNENGYAKFIILL